MCAPNAKKRLATGTHRLRHQVKILKSKNLDFVKPAQHMASVFISVSIPALKSLTNVFAPACKYIGPMLYLYFGQTIIKLWFNNSIFVFNSCFGQSVDDEGRKKTLSVTQQCCRGYGRKKNSKSSNIWMPCEEVHLRSLIETSERLNGLEFIRAAQKNDADTELRQNVTLFMPTDAVFTEFAEQLLESVGSLILVRSQRDFFIQFGVYLS